MYGWVPASTSGFTRSDTFARLPVADAIADSLRNSLSDSTLKQRTECSSASRISASLLPTPENTTLAGSPPAASTRWSSPPETMSKPAPARASRSMIARFEFAFSA
jgi:hypothetical protein